jgi:hypothetical protein
MPCFSFYLFSFFSYKIREQKGRTSPAHGGKDGTCGRGEEMKKGDRRVTMVKKCVHMYVSTKMISVEMTPGIGEGRDKGEW